MKELSLLGRKYTISDGREKYISIVNKYNRLALKNEELFNEKYAQQFKDIDSVIDHGLELGNQIIEEVVEQECIGELVANGFFSYDADRFLNEYYFDKYYEFEKHFNEIADEYAEIVFTQEQQHQYREARKDSRGRWQGGGFGAKGAIKGAATAGAMNMASGAAHSIFNSIGNMMTDSDARRKKRELFGNSDTLKILDGGLYLSIANLAYAMMDFYNMNTDIKVENVSDEQRKEAGIILGNLKKFNISNEKKIDLIYQILYLDPLNKETYLFTLGEFGDANHELERFAHEFAINLRDEKRHIIEDDFATININDKKSLQEGRLRLKERADYLGTFSASYIVKIDNALNVIAKKESIASQIDEIEEKASLDFLKVEPIKKELDEYCDSISDITESKEILSVLLKRVDGEFAYSEWLLFDAFNGTVMKYVNNTQKNKCTFEMGVYAIEELLREYDEIIISTLNDFSPNNDIMRNFALNVLRAAVHCSAILGLHSIIDLSEKISVEGSIKEFQKRIDLYSKEEKYSNFEHLNQCKAILYEGADQGIALACILIANSFFDIEVDEKTKCLYIEKAAKKYYPDAVCQQGTLLITNNKSVQDILQGVYWLNISKRLGIDVGIDLSQSSVVGWCNSYIQESNTTRISVDEEE